MSEIVRETQVRSNRLPLIFIGFALLILIAIFINVRFGHRGQDDKHIEQGINALNARKFEEAEREWREALKESPQRPEPYLLLSEFYVTSGHPEEALSLLQGLEKIAPSTKQLYRRLAESYSLTGQTVPALEAAKKAIEQDPSDSAAHALLGIQLGNQMDARGSVSELSKAALLSPQDDKIALSLAQAQLDAGDFAGAEATARKVIARNDRYATAYYLLGWSFSRRDPSPDTLIQAITAFRKATELDPKRADAFAELGRLSSLKGDALEAQKALKKAWDLGLHDGTTAFNLASAYRKTGDAKNATLMSQEFKRISDYTTRTEALQKTLRVSPENIEAALQLAELDIEAEKYEDALPLLQKILQFQRQNLRALRAAEKLYTRIGDTKNATFYRERIRSFAKP